MTEIDKRLKVAKKKVSVVMRSAQWKKSVRNADKQVNTTLEKLRLECRIDPMLLDEPATL